MEKDCRNCWMGLHDAPNGGVWEQCSYCRDFDKWQEYDKEADNIEKRSW